MPAVAVDHLHLDALRMLQLETRALSDLMNADVTHAQTLVTHIGLT